MSLVIKAIDLNLPDNGNGYENLEFSFFCPEGIVSKTETGNNFVILSHI